MTNFRKTYLFAYSLLLTAAILAFIAIVGLIYNPQLFASFSWFVVIFIALIAIYLLYNIKKLTEEMNKKQVKFV